MPDNCLIEVQNLTVSFKRFLKKENVVLNNVSLKIHPDKVTVILGRNGSGKSTLLKIIAHSTENDFDRKAHLSAESAIIFHGENMLRKYTSETKRRFDSSIAYTKQTDDLEFFDSCDTVESVLMDSCDASDITQKKRAVEEMLQYFAAEKIKSQRINMLSGGQFRLLSIMSCFIQKEKSIYLIDEPFNDLDEDKARRVSNYIKEMIDGRCDIAIVVVTHCRKIIRTANEVEAYRLENGRIEACDYETMYCLGEVVNGRYKV